MELHFRSYEINRYFGQSEQECEQWLLTYQVAKSSISHRPERLQQCARAVERDLQLLGAVGIEDELQEVLNNMRIPPLIPR